MGGQVLWSTKRANSSTLGGSAPRRLQVRALAATAWANDERN